MVSTAEAYVPVCSEYIFGIASVYPLDLFGVLETYFLYYLVMLFTHHFSSMHYFIN